MRIAWAQPDGILWLSIMIGRVLVQCSLANIAAFLKRRTE
jgi:hypothetical protein